jgi:hypothetical protein
MRHKKLRPSAPGTYQIIFRVQNLQPPEASNPAGFLAQTSGAGVSGDLLTSVAWDWAIAAGADPSDFNALTWAAATSYGNNGGYYLWTLVNGGNPITGISTSAEWIWDDKNTVPARLENCTATMNAGRHSLLLFCCGNLQLRFCSHKQQEPPLAVYWRDVTICPVW